MSLSIQSSTLTKSLEGVCNVLMTPFQKGYHAIQKGIHMLWAGFTELDDVQDELLRVRNKLQRYEALTEELTEIQKENKRFRILLQLQERIQYESLPATIISKDPDNWFRTIIINRGSTDGIKINMPIISFSGEKKAVVGKVIEVRRSVARVLPIISTNMKLGVMFKGSRFPGLLSGFSQSSNLCIMDYINKSASIELGDIVITSGQGGIFPSGLLVGVVKKSLLKGSSAFQRVAVKPTIDYTRLEEVFVVKKEPNEELLELIDMNRR